MSQKGSPAAKDLLIATAARFVLLPKPLSKAAVGRLFDRVLSESAGRRVSQEVRFSHGLGGSSFTASFLCFRVNPIIKFLEATDLEEIRYGFVLLVERRGYLAIFHHLAKGLDRSVNDLSRPIDRQRVTHIWSDQAQYQRISTRRMTISTQELRSASYEADDLETAFVPALAGRSIPKSLGLTTRDYGGVGVTPGTGRIRVSSKKVNLKELFEFIDRTLDGVEANADSDFLSAFPISIDVEDLESTVEPTGLLVDAAQLRELLNDSTTTIEPPSPNLSSDDLLQKMSAVLDLRADSDGWIAADATGNAVGHVKRLKHSFGFYSDLAKGFVLRSDSGEDTPLDKWVREQDAFSLSFSSPDYFYAGGDLFKTSGFLKEAALVRQFFEPHSSLNSASSEKGEGYSTTSRRFGAKSIFRILEDDLSTGDDHLLCGDLGDEWADYIGLRKHAITFYHCKHGDVTAGASDLQIVSAQALKNLGRIKFRHDEIGLKLDLAEDRKWWSDTRIPLLARGTGGWSGLRDELVRTAADPNTRWRVSLVATALSRSAFDAAAASANVKPHFVQQVWLLSAFVSSCRERDAQPVIVCRP